MVSEYDAAKTAPVERVARVLAGHALSRNAEGDMGSAGAAVDDLAFDVGGQSLEVRHRCRCQLARGVSHAAMIHEATQFGNASATDSGKDLPVQPFYFAEPLD